jgi:DNA repair protein SbcD/Mre11
VRFVHTSDWHAGRTWKGKDRSDELAAVLNHLADYLERERIELLLVSGDVFDSGAPVAHAEKIVFGFFKRVGRAGTKSIVIAGNHDSPHRIEAWGMLAELVDVHAVGLPRPISRGGVITFESRERERVNVAVVPFAPTRTLVTALELAADETQARQRYADGMAQIVDHLATSFRADAVNLMMAHTHLEGASFSGSERRVHLGDEWAATPQVFPSTAHYVALGHIHRPQRVEAASAPTEYAGSPMQMDFGEVGEDKSFVVVDARPKQPAGVERVRYEGAKELRDVRATLAELERDAAGLRDQGWLRVKVPLPTRDPDLNAKVRRIVPNAVSVDEELPEVESSPEVVRTSSMSPAEAYRAYFQSEHGAAPEDAVVEKFTTLYADEMGS